MPTPGSPRSATTCPWPAPARARACCSASSSGCRPTKGDSPRATAVCKRRRRVRGPDQLEDLHRLRQAFNGHRADRGDLNKPLGEAQDGRREQNRARDGHLLHAGGQMGRLAHRRVIHVQITANGAHHHLTGIQPDADLERDALRALDLGGVLLDGRPACAAPHSRPAPHGPHVPGARQTAP